MKIESVGDSTGDDIPQQSRERVLLPVDVPFGNFSNHFRGDCVIHSRFSQGFPPERMSQPCTQRDHQFQCASDAENYRSFFPVEGFLGVISSILKRLFCRNETQKLRGISRFQIPGSDAVFQRMKRNGGEECSAVAIGSIRGIFVRVVIIIRSPVAIGDLTHMV